MFGFELSHPSKARMGHPWSCGLMLPEMQKQVPRLARDDGGGCSMSASAISQELQLCRKTAYTRIWCDSNHCNKRGLNLSYIECRPNWSHIKALRMDQPWLPLEIQAPTRNCIEPVENSSQIFLSIELLSPAFSRCLGIRWRKHLRPGQGPGWKRCCERSYHCEGDWHGNGAADA